MANEIRRPARETGRNRIVDAAIELYREIGHEKATVADIARETSMSSANVYRFFPSRQAIEDAIVEKLLDQVVIAAAAAAGEPDEALQRLPLVLSLIAKCMRIVRQTTVGCMSLWPLLQLRNGRSRCPTWIGFAGSCARS
ncbi:TetR/AcrR family transcriptional regulator [Bradyrhizobium sp. PMVTL-01]|uniref:TetR/AcrR family transcriptional regulator n=1 Tax=unclassified Bradyrhizobium TaxID=2631580 RepID=UPI003F722A56